jgi:hypothetical protein
MTDLQKKLRNRWGKKFKDARDWPVYDGQLVKRGEYFLDLDWVEHWSEELAAMNAGKEGKPFRFPKSLIELQAVWHAKNLDYRMIEGITRRLCVIGQLPEYNDHTTVNRRVNRLELKLALPTSEHVVLFSDGTGVQAVAGGEYLREKYGKKNRRWVQIIVLGDAKTHEPISFEVNIIPASEPESTAEQFKELLAQGVHIVAAGGDGGMDEKNLWGLLEKTGIAPIIKPDKNARDDTKQRLRNRVVKERNRLGYKRWAKKRHYGARWPATEGIHSAFKRIFGEQLRATSEIGMLQEAGCKVWAYQRLKRYGEA